MRHESAAFIRTLRLPTTYWAAPVFAEPGSSPVATLPRDYVYDGTIVPVIEKYSDHYIHPQDHNHNNQKDIFRCIE